MVTKWVDWLTYKPLTTGRGCISKSLGIRAVVVIIATPKQL